MPVSRMRMRPWLEKMIESTTVSGLTWVDKEKTMFSIPWKHAARHGWEMDKDACLFKLWALHTGKYIEGQACDPKTWKANFRCALNSLPDIEEVKNRSVHKGHQAMRIFKMLPATPKRRKEAKEAKSRKKTSAIKMQEDTDYSDTQSPLSDSSLSEESTQESTVDSTVHTEQEDLLLFPSTDVPTEIVDDGPGSFSHNFYQRFQVSPAHIPETDFNDVDDVIKICQQLENELHWESSSDEGMGFLNNEPCTSPGGQWSESSSVDELDELRQYTTLDSNFVHPADDWACFHDHRIPMF